MTEPYYFTDELMMVRSTSDGATPARREKTSSESDVPNKLTEDENVSAHLTGDRRKMPTTLPLHQRSTSRRDFEKVSPGWEALMSAKTPISPSVPTNAFLNRIRQSERAKQKAKVDMQQLCFGMDTSTMSDANGNSRSIIDLDDSSGVSSVSASESGLKRQSVNDDTLRSTHRAQHSFCARHEDEISLDTGDPVFVENTSSDHWCTGTNIRSGHTGIFPSLCVVEVDIEEELFGKASSNLALRHHERDTFALTFLGSVEVAHHKGNDVLVQAINKVLNQYQSKEETIVPKYVVLEINYQGIHLIQKGRGRNIFHCPQFDYFYSLQNISFCGVHPKQFRYFGYITKHPLLPRFACHVFLSKESTQPVVESIGRAFKRSYDEYMAFQHPTEDIYIE